MKRYLDMTEEERAVWTLKHACHAAHSGGFCGTPKRGDYLDEKQERALKLFERSLETLAKVRELLAVLETESGSEKTYCDMSDREKRELRALVSP